MPFYPPNIARCTHIKTNGTQCGSPALRRGRFCFFHKNWRDQRVHLNRKAVANARPSINLPVLEDAESVQVALMQVLRLILAGQIEPKIAGLLLYGLQTASLNLKQARFEPRMPTDVVIDPSAVDEKPLGAQLWEPEDFEDEEEEDDEDDEDEEDEEENEEQEEDDEEEEEDDDEDQDSGYSVQSKGGPKKSAQPKNVPPDLPEVRENIRQLVKDRFAEVGIELSPKPPQPATTQPVDKAGGKAGGTER